MNLSGKKLVLAVSGGIAAYKAADLASRLRKSGAEVRVTMTRSAKQFVAPLTFEAISGHPIYDELFNQANSYRMEHIEWARWADALIVAPATADFMARMAHGIADDAPLTLYLAFRGPIWIAPTMNTAMWDHPATQDNLQTLVRRGIRVIGPGSGLLACGEVGEGRMAEPDDIIRIVEKDLSAATSAGPLAGKTVLITAGPTRESLDPIRFISNRSSGKMGVALASAAKKLGARVILIHGPLEASIPDGIEAVPVENAEAMMKAVQERFAQCDVAIFAAAVANYRVPAVSDQKIQGGEKLRLDLVRTPDIAAWAGAHRNGNQVLAGFAAESQDLLASAQKKLKAKGLDLIFANPIGVAGVGFQADQNEVTMLTRKGDQVSSGRLSKEQTAEWIWKRILGI